MVERDAPKLERYTSAARSSTKGRRVQELMISVQADIQALTGNYAIKTATKMQVEALLAEMTVFRSSKLCGLKASISNHGAGQQIIHEGMGDQNINTGSGTQWNGTFTAPFHCYLPPS